MRKPPIAWRQVAFAEPKERMYNPSEPTKTAPRSRLIDKYRSTRRLRVVRAYIDAALMLSAFFANAELAADLDRVTQRLEQMQVRDLLREQVAT
jgi:hypothetical protein